MADQLITNPAGAHRSVSDFKTFKDSSGERVALPSSQSEVFRASAAVAKGEVVEWVVPTATVPLSVKPMTTSTVGMLFAGVANEAGAAGDYIRITTSGGCFVDVAAETAAFGEPLAIPATTAGKAEIGAALAATNIVGTVIGVALAAKDSSNLAPAVITHA